MQDITADYSREELGSTERLEAVAKVTVAGKTDLGRVRENNEDKFEFFMPEDKLRLATKGQIFVVCDGMGGHSAGQIASELAVKTFIDVYLNHPSTDPVTAITGAVKAAHRFVTDVGRAVPSRRGMGTTLTGLILKNGKAWVVNIGDSRTYRLRDQNFECLTVDHTWIEDVVRAGMMSRHEAENHQYRHVITRAIGADGEAEPDVKEFDLLAGDVYLLCSDGVMNHVDDAALAETLVAKPPADAAWSIVGQALMGGGSDNTTVLIVRVDDVQRVSSPA
jgi:PPM family protein phosphatase